MSNGWNYEVALTEVVDAIDDGAKKLTLNELGKKMVKDVYRESFKVITEDTWKANRDTVLDLARQAGASSEMATIVLWVNGIGAVSEFMDPETVCLVCVMVSRLHCSIIRGGLCPDVHAPGQKGIILDQILEQLG